MSNRGNKHHTVLTTSGGAASFQCSCSATYRNDASTDGFHLLQALLMTEADRRGSAVVTEIMAISDGSTVEEPGSPELSGRVVDRIRTDPVEVVPSIRQSGSNS